LVKNLTICNRRRQCLGQFPAPLFRHPSLAGNYDIRTIPTLTAETSSAWSARLIESSFTTGSELYTATSVGVQGKISIMPE